ncbi:hypothetical protein EB796_016897 [Bugula neritina]|uniref:Uncharacterized protein n=1 Tax=Bugula neritina TaxID=10212 RepID=A0A7J7JG43_BUGNE|nr:hypothetical protein EB796_016897 [Bugula neritina]
MIYCAQSTSNLLVISLQLMWKYRVCCLPSEKCKLNALVGCFSSALSNTVSDWFQLPSYRKSVITVNVCF